MLFEIFEEKFTNVNAGVGGGGGVRRFGVRCGTGGEGRHRGRPVYIIYTALTALFLFSPAPDPTLATPQSADADSVSLRLGHGAALTCPRHVIHYRAAASLPKRGAEGVRGCLCAHLKPLSRSAAPSRGSGTKCRRGRRSSDTSRGEKTSCTSNTIVGDGHCAVPMYSTAALKSPYTSRRRWTCWQPR